MLLSDKRWGQLGPFLGGVVTVVMILLGLKALQQPEPKLVMIGESSSLTLPPLYEGMVGSLTDASGKLVAELSDSASRSTARRIKSVLDTIAAARFEFRGTVTGTIVNRGGKAAENLTLLVPRSLVTSITREGGASEVRIAEGPIQLATLQPNKWVRIVVWTDRNLDKADVERVTLAHKDGSGKVRLTRNVGGVALSLANHPVRFALGWLAFSFVVAGMILLIDAKRLRNALETYWSG